MKYSFNKSSLECQPRSGCFKPSVAFEVFNGVSGISGFYEFPEGMTPRAFEYEIRSWERVLDYYRFDPSGVRLAGEVPSFYIDKRREMVSALVALNPSLSEIDYDPFDALNMHHFLFGVASLFSPDDVKFFMELKKVTRFCASYAMKIPGYAELSDEINARVEMPRRWVASMNTMLEIKRQLDLKP